MLDLIDIEEVEHEVEENSERETRINESIVRINSFKTSTASKNPPILQDENGTTPRDVLQASSPARSGSSFNMDTQSRVHLPKINLQKFSGDSTQYYSFWQSFEHSVH